MENLQFEQVLDPLQQKLYGMALSCIDKDEDPEAQVEYSIDIRRIAEFSEVNAGAVEQNMEKVVKAFGNIKFRPVMDDKDKITFPVYVFQEVAFSKIDPYLITVRFNYAFRKQVLKMKKEYDIEDPTQTIM
ncbi:RepB family plasmid replication initiator protein [Selenomonas ruminantium]|uniref:Initiator Rep protein WH1 domain-containing protein n=1 Tax=Selenomonas ruminantium TaxID=971 RepID=A0A1H4AIK5_SELRU|nr:RepB family plasmid replication initiator protein [Selenomonas ruminantium]SEA35677.1 hypothetical protein SAMN05660648_02905 [Selenomonas ruminantium]